MTTDEPAHSPDAVAEAVTAFRDGQVVLIIQEESQIAAVAAAGDHVSPEVLQRMSSICTSAVFLVAGGDRLDALGIRSMAGVDANRGYRDFGVSINAAGRTGLTLEDRAEVFRRVTNPLAVPQDFTWPGHTIPIRARSRGLLARQTVSEAALDLARLSDLHHSCALGLIFDQGGRSLSLGDLRGLQEAHSLPMISVESLLRHRLLEESFLETVTDCDLPINDRLWRLIAYRDLDSGHPHVALIRRGPTAPKAMPLYTQEPCALGLVFGSPTCSCRVDLDDATARMNRTGRGMVIHIDAADMSNEVLFEIAGSAPDQPRSNDRHPHRDIEVRDYIGVGWILRDLGIREVELMQTNPSLASALEAHGIPFTDHHSG